MRIPSAWRRSRDSRVVTVQGMPRQYLLLVLGLTILLALVVSGIDPYDRTTWRLEVAPVLIAREILVRGGYVSGARMTAFLSACVALAISAFYELIEWWAALALGGGAIEFLGTQGDPWDTQSDMFLVLVAF